MSRRKSYIPALGYDWLTPLYDPLLRWGMREEKFKQHLIAQARIEPGHRVLDLGCGTGTLTILIKQMHPNAKVSGLDADPKVLDIAQTKVATARVKVSLDSGMAFELPYADGSFDRVLSSLMFHHLTRENKQRTGREVYRILRPGGELHIVDFGKAHGVYASLFALMIQTFRFEEATDNVRGRLLEIFHDSGFDPVEELAYYTTIVGGLSLYRARKPDGT